jgi:hypothetical protein
MLIGKYDIDKPKNATLSGNNVTLCAVECDIGVSYLSHFADEGLLSDGLSHF